MSSAGGPPVLTDDTIIVLDIDDTLYLEESYVRSGFAAVGRHMEVALGATGVGDTLWSNFLAGVRGDAFDQALPAHGVDPTRELIGTLIEVYRNHRPEIELAPDAEAFLHGLDGRPAAAITDGPAESQRRKAEALGLDRFLDPIIVTADLGPGFSKPHHRAFEIVEQAFGAPASRCMHVGDNPAKDFVAPQARGWSSIRLRRPASLHVAEPTPAGVAELDSFAPVSNGNHRGDPR